MLRNFWDVVRSRMDAPGAAVLIGVKDDRPILLAAGSDEAVAAGFNAGNIIKTIAPLVSGGGCGKPTRAQAGGKDASGIPARSIRRVQNLVLPRLMRKISAYRPLQVIA